MIDIVKIAQLPPREVYDALQSNPDGLASEEALRRREKYGPNVLRQQKRTPLIKRFLSNLTHLMAILLWAASAMAFVAEMPQLGIAIIAVILINAAFSFWQEYHAERATEALKRLLPSYARVLRDGLEQRIVAEDLVPGDVVLLAEGDVISADARLVEEFELRTNNATLTGESMPVRRSAEAILRTDLAKTDLPNLVFAGTSVATGTGRAVVFATGMETELGRITDLTQTVKEEPSPIQMEVARIVRWITASAVGLGIVFFALGAAVAGMTLAEAFIFGVGIIVAFVPEGLLPTVTLSLAMGVQRMAKRNALIKKLSAVETLGCATVICTDKTGTLTQNEMTVLRLWAGNREYQVTGYGYEPKGAILNGDGTPAPADDTDLTRLLTISALCNNARLLPPNDEMHPRWSILGDPTEAALLVVAAKHGLEAQTLSRQEVRLREFPFDSRRRRMSTIHLHDGQPMLYVKGAPVEVLSLCDRILVGGEIAPLDEGTRARIIALNDEYASQALRVLAAAYKPLAEEERTSTEAERVERGLVFVGLVAMMDPPRPEVARAVELCHRAHVRIIMITGDYGLTARSIATRLGIFEPEAGRVISGSDLAVMPESELLDTLRSKDDVIFARVSPEDKLRVVSALKTLDEIVAVTGDGVNDAPALRRADIGIAMGLSGTDVAREAADMILTDDNFASIVNAIEEGRAVYNNIKKFATYVFASNGPEAVPFIAYALSGGAIPLGLTVMQILAVDLGTDLVPAMGLGADLPESGIMDGPPRSIKSHLVDASLLGRAYGWLGLIEGVLAMVGFYSIYWSRGFAGILAPLPGPEQAPLLYATATTATFAGIVTSQIGNVFACRSSSRSAFALGFFSNRIILLGIAVETVLLLSLVYIPALQSIFGTAPLNLADWPLLITFGPLLLLLEEIRKWLVRRARARHVSRERGAA